MSETTGARGKRRAAAPGVVALLEGKEVVWTPSDYGQSGYVVCDDAALLARIREATSVRRWAPVLGVMVLASDKSAVGFLASLYAVAHSGVQVLSVPDEVVDWLNEQKRRTTQGYR